MRDVLPLSMLRLIHRKQQFFTTTIMIDKKSHIRRRLYRFRDFTFDAESLELRKLDERVPLRMQPARLLKILLHNAPDTVSRRTIQETIWDNGVTIEFDHGLNACASQLRYALGDSANSPQFIETLPKRGYRFIAEIDADAPMARLPRFGMAIAMGLVLLVAAFSLLQRDPDETPAQAARVYVAPVAVDDSIAMEIDTIAQSALRLGTVHRLMNSHSGVLQVINGSTLWSDFADTDAATESDFTVLLKLSSSDSRFSLQATMRNRSRNGVPATRRFQFQTLDATSLGRLSESVSSWIASELDLPAVPYSAASDVNRPPKYYDAIYRARRALQLSDHTALLDSLHWFSEALAISPSSAEAKGGKAIALSVLAGSPDFPSAQTYRRAMELAADIRASTGPTAYSEIVRGNIFLYRDWDLPRSRQAFDIAAELAPGEAIVHAWRAGILAAQSEVAAAADAAELAVRLDPLSMANNADRCWFLAAADKFGEAIASCRWSLEIDPDDAWSSIGLAVAHSKLGQEAEAYDALQPIAEVIIKRESKDLSAQSQYPLDNSGEYQRSYQGLNCQIADLVQARTERGDYSKVLQAAWNAGCGRFQPIPELLRQAKSERETGVLFYRTDPRFDEFRQQPIAANLEMRITDEK